MVKILEGPEENIITTVAITELHPEDWDKVMVTLEKKTEQFGPIRWCFEIRDFGQYPGEVNKENIRFSPLNSERIERVALIGNKNWQGWLKDLTEPLLPAEIRFFETIYQDEAHKWLRS